MAELAKLIVFEVAYQYWREACGFPTRAEYMEIVRGTHG